MSEYYAPQHCFPHVRQAPANALCLNPTCPSDQRLCNFEVERSSSKHFYQQHPKCEGWIYGLSYLREKQPDEGHYVFRDTLTADYFNDPVGSVYYIERFATQWETNLHQYFEGLRKSIITELQTAYEKCRTSLSAHMLQNRKAYQSIQSLCQDSCFAHADFQMGLSYMLRAMQQTGKVVLRGQEALEKKRAQVMREIESIELALWNREASFDLKQRMEAQTRKEQLFYFTSTASLQDINHKLQEIQSLFRKQLRFEEDGEEMQVQCLICPHMVTSQEASSKLRRKWCRFSVLHHMCTAHTEQILFRTPRAHALKLSLEQLRDEVAGRRKVVVVDKENINNINWNNFPLEPDVYYLEILSQNSEHLARTRYLMAESKGRDAADILVIIVLYELSRLRVQQVELLTKDHFGQTLLPILAGMGLTVTLINKPPN